MIVHLIYIPYRVISLVRKRVVLLDNSLFELRKAFPEASAFAKWITELRPRDYIVPDAYAVPRNHQFQLVQMVVFRRVVRGIRENRLVLQVHWISDTIICFSAYTDSQIL